MAVVFNIRVPEEMADRIARFQRDMKASTKSAAVLHLLEGALTGYGYSPLVETDPERKGLVSVVDPTPASPKKGRPAGSSSKNKKGKKSKKLPEIMTEAELAPVEAEAKRLCDHAKARIEELQARYSCPELVGQVIEKLEPACRKDLFLRVEHWETLGVYPMELIEEAINWWILDESPLIRGLSELVFRAVKLRETAGAPSPSTSADPPSISTSTC